MASVKLSVTVRSALSRKYGPSALARIDAAIAAWIAADKQRGIETVHVALDDAAAMRAQGVSAVSGKATALRAKRAVDALAKKLNPDYIVIIGGDDVVPFFHVPNPSYDPDGDTDRTVPTDNPYACSRPYGARSLASYLVPDRVVGRITDLPAAPGAGDSQWIVASLKTATGWRPKPRSFYADVYATCCDEWKEAGIATMQYLGARTADLMISPPTTDASTTARNRLARTLHFTKCHGAEIDANFYGQQGSSYPLVLFSGTVKGKLKPGTLAAAMCCYGAQVYSPSDPVANPPGAISIAMAYLRGGAAGFVGATKIAWVGPEVMMCADWIVASFLKKALEGASTGRALLEAKQDYLQFLVNQGQRPDSADDKTMIEFVLLGDPSVHPVAGAAPARAAFGAPVVAMPTAVRTERRLARVALAAQVVRALPARVALGKPDPAVARKLFSAVSGLLDKRDAQLLDPARVSAIKLVAAAASRVATTAVGRLGVAALGHRLGDSVEYAWTGRRVVDGRVEVRLLSVQADAEGNVLRSRLLHSA